MYSFAIGKTEKSYMVVIKSKAIPNERPNIIEITPIIGVRRVMINTARPAFSSYFGYSFASVPFNLYSTNAVTVSNPYVESLKVPGTQKLIVSTSSSYPNN